MSDAYIGEIRMFGFDFVPKGWMLCDGSEISIAANSALFSLLGTMYGPPKNAANFRLPDFAGAAPVAPGAFGPGQLAQGQRKGEQTVSLDATEMPVHGHGLQRKGALKPIQDKTPAPSPTSNLASVTGVNTAGMVEAIPSFLTNATPNTMFHPDTIEFVGADQPHENMQPYLVLNICICAQGIFPAR